MVDSASFDCCLGGDSLNREVLLLSLSSYGTEHRYICLACNLLQNGGYITLDSRFVMLLILSQVMDVQNRIDIAVG